MKHNDGERAMLWPKEHWHVAAFACVCVLLVAAVLVEAHALSVGAAVAASLASVVYVVLTTWRYTRQSAPEARE